MGTSSNQPDENMTVMATSSNQPDESSNQPDENMTAGTSKPEDDGMLLPPRIPSTIKEISEVGNSDGEDNESDGEDNESDEGQKYGLSWFDDFQMLDDKSVVDQAYGISRLVAYHAKSCPRLRMVLNDKVELVNVIIEKLPVSWEDYAATLKDMQMQKELTFGALVNHLRVEEEKRAQDQKVEEEKRAQDQNVEFVEEKEYSKYLPLYKAAFLGDWEKAKTFFDDDEGALTAPINEFSETALFVAAAEGRNTIDFVKQLVGKMPDGSVDKDFGYVLNSTSYVGNTEAVKVILSKYPSLVYYRDDNYNKWTPFTQAAANGMRDTLLYLLGLVMNDEDSSKLFPDEHSAAALMDETIRSGYYDIALYLVKKYSAFTTQDNCSFGLKLLASKAASAFKSGTQYQWWQRIIYAYVSVKSVDLIISPTQPVSDENPIGSSTLTVSVENPVGSPTQTVSVENPIGSPSLTVPVENENPVGSPTQTVSVENPVGSPSLTVSVENPVDNRDQVMGRSLCNWVEYFCISVPCIKHIQKQKEMHLQTLELVKYFCEGIASLSDSAKHRSLTGDAIMSAAKNEIPEIVHEILNVVFG